MTPLLAQAAVDSPRMLQGMLLLLIVAILFALIPLLLFAFVRRQLHHKVKGEPYECGEPAVGESWVQFDLRFYVAALVFVVFDVEIALFYPWAVVYKQAGIAGLWDMLFFFGVLVVGYLYLWRFGYLDWVRTTAPRQITRRPTPKPSSMLPPTNGAAQRKVKSPEPEPVEASA